MVSDVPLLQLRPELVHGVAIVDLLVSEMTESHQATLLGQALRAIFDGGASTRLIINASATRYIASSVFAVLLGFGIRTIEAGGKVAICSMDPFVRDGARIIKFNRILPIFDDELGAVAAMIA